MKVGHNRYYRLCLFVNFQSHSIKYLKLLLSSFFIISYWVASGAYCTYKELDSTLNMTNGLTYIIKELRIVFNELGFVTVRNNISYKNY